MRGGTRVRFPRDDLGASIKVATVNAASEQQASPRIAVIVPCYNEA
jgi:hypothetical protein